MVFGGEEHGVNTPAKVGLGTWLKSCITRQFSLAQAPPRVVAEGGTWLKLSFTLRTRHGSGPCRRVQPSPVLSRDTGASPGGLWRGGRSGCSDVV